MTFKKALRIDGHRDGGTLQIWMQRGQNISKIHSWYQEYART